VANNSNGLPLAKWALAAVFVAACSSDDSSGMTDGGHDSGLPDAHAPEADASHDADASTAMDASTMDAAQADASTTVDSGPDEADSGAADGLRAFVGAEGFGTETPGGRGGRVITVTTLEASGPGSLTEALRSTGPRIVVFRVSGVIDLAEDIDLTEEQSYLTVAGQSSPGGITIRGGGALISYHSGFHDAVFRHLRFRGNGNYDNLSFAEVHHIVIDHCDFSGAEDEALDITYAHDVTVQWSTYSNSGPGGQRYGWLLAYAPTTNISIHHNFSAHHVNRCAPHMHWGDEGPPPEGARIDYVNNVIYDCAFEKIMDVSGPDSSMLIMNMIGNVAIAGPNTPMTDGVRFTNLGTSTTLFAEDNVYEPDHDIFSPLYHEAQMIAARHPFPAITTHSATDARERVLANVGAWPRDAMNTRTIADVAAGTGALGDVGDPLIEGGPAAPEDTDSDGMPDAWEEMNGLNPASDADAAADRDDDGYTNIEEYLDELAASLLP
jgi:hypothetical protein